MIFILLSIVCSVLLGFIFKLFNRYGVDSFQAIVVNYATCVTCGWIHLGHFPIQTNHWGQAWLPYALGLGFIFISGFTAVAMTVRYFGVTVSQVMQKMSILMVVPVAILVYQESAGWGKIMGFLMALSAIILVNWPQNKTTEPSSGRSKIWIPVVAWALAGILEVLFLVVNKRQLTDLSDPTFICTVFGTAGCIGGVAAFIGWQRGWLKPQWKNVLGGIILGIPNYGSMLFLLMALASGMEGSFVFPVANVGIIIATTIGAVTLFHERLSRLNWLGIALAVAAIAFISW
jgi:drug/metabolite transporter (DMT)-like permease